MNPSAWSNPPPPGIDVDEESKHSTVSSKTSITGSIIDVIDPYIKNPEYIKYKKSLSKERAYYNRRSRSRSYDRNRSRSRDRRRKYRSRTRSRGRRRRSRSRSRGRRYARRYSHSSSQSRSSSHERRHRSHKKKRSRRHSRSRSRSNRYKSERTRSRRSRSHSHSPSDLNDSFVDNDPDGDKGDDNDNDDDISKENAFKNDGSFLEMFKKMQEEKEKAEAEAAAASSSEPKKPLPAFGKRRGGRVLKTGMVEKTKTCDDDELSNSQDPWSIYLKEVKKYKEACCDDDSKTRPLVK